VQGGDCLFRVRETWLNLLQVLVATSTLAWGVNTPAHLVIIKGTEYYDAPSKRSVDFPITDVLQVSSYWWHCAGAGSTAPGAGLFVLARQQLMGWLCIVSNRLASRNSPESMQVAGFQSQVCEQSMPCRMHFIQLFIFVCCIVSQC